MGGQWGRGPLGPGLGKGPIGPWGPGPMMGDRDRLEGRDRDRDDDGDRGPGRPDGDDVRPRDGRGHGSFGDGPRGGMPPLGRPDEMGPPPWSRMGGQWGPDRPRGGEEGKRPADRPRHERGDRESLKKPDKPAEKKIESEKKADGDSKAAEKA